MFKKLLVLILVLLVFLSGVNAFAVSPARRAKRLHDNIWEISTRAYNIEMFENLYGITPVDPYTSSTTYANQLGTIINSLVTYEDVDDVFAIEYQVTF